jgi:hypothetical protein
VKSREETRSLATFPRPMSATGRMAKTVYYGFST